MQRSAPSTPSELIEDIDKEDEEVKEEPVELPRSLSRNPRPHLNRFLSYQDVNDVRPRSFSQSEGRGRRRHRTISLSTQNTVNTEREPILLDQKQNKTIFIQGRPPWFNKEGDVLREPFLIGICGGSASGKTTVANNVIQELNVPWVTLLSMDSCEYLFCFCFNFHFLSFDRFLVYKVLSQEQHEASARNEYNFDHPEAIDFSLLKETLKNLKEFKKVEVPIYNFMTHKREEHKTELYGADIIIFEGIFAFHDEVSKNLKYLFFDANQALVLGNPKHAQYEDFCRHRL